jgi:hypothetical protein
MKWILFVYVATVSSVACQELYSSYNFTSVELSRAGFCPSTEILKLREKIREDVAIFLNESVLPKILATRGSCSCGGPGWRRAAYLNMLDPAQTCPPAWELIATPRRSCARPSNAGVRTCHSAMFPTQGIQYSQVCGRIVAYQVGEPQAFVLENTGIPQTIDGPYVDGLSLTYGNPRQHIWTFAASLDETTAHNPASRCACTITSPPNRAPSFVGNDYFCETGVPPGQNFNRSVFYADDALWDGQGCGSNSTCCTFNNPPWFCRQLPQSTDADLEMRLCSAHEAAIENTPIQLVEIYVK